MADSQISSFPPLVASMEKKNQYKIINWFSKHLYHNEVLQSLMKFVGLQKITLTLSNWHFKLVYSKLSLIFIRAFYTRKMFEYHDFSTYYITGNRICTKAI